MIEIGRTLVMFLPDCCSEYRVEEEGSGEDRASLVYRFTSFMTLSLKVCMLPGMQSEWKNRWESFEKLQT